MDELESADEIADTIDDERPGSDPLEAEVTSPNVEEEPLSIVAAVELDEVPVIEAIKLTLESDKIDCICEEAVGIVESDAVDRIDDEGVSSSETLVVDFGTVAVAPLELSADDVVSALETLGFKDAEAEAGILDGIDANAVDSATDEACAEAVLSLLVSERLFNVEVSEFRKPDEGNDTSELGKMLTTVLEGAFRVWEVYVLEEESVTVETPEPADDGIPIALDEITEAVLERPADDEDTRDMLGVFGFVELMELKLSVLERPAEDEETIDVLEIFGSVELMELGELELEAELEAPVKMMVEGSDVLTTVLEISTGEVPMLKVPVLGTLLVEETELMVGEDMIEDKLGD